MRIDFVTSRFSAGAEIAYPLIRFRKALARAGLDIRIRHELPSRNEASDVLILTHPHYRDRCPNNTTYYRQAEVLIERDIEYGRAIARKVVFYDTQDSTASRYLRLLPIVDLMLKWQVLKNVDYYCSAEYETRSRVWLPGAQGPRPRASSREVHKLQVGWNLALRNYTLFRKGGRHLHWRGITWGPRYTPVRKTRPLLTFFRGGMSGDRGDHRGRAIAALEAMRHPSILLGPPVRRLQYLREMQASRAIVSPFGHGEPCYRDMECFIHGSILVKPRMDHLTTFPNVFIPNETYIPVEWDFSDLPSALTRIDADYEAHMRIAQRGQDLYRELTDDPRAFVQHMTSIVERLFA